MDRCYKVLIIILISFSFLILSGCNLLSKDSNEINAGNISSGNGTTDNLTDGKITAIANDCTAQWKCVSKTDKMYQLGNCTLTNRVKCPLGCYNDTCIVGKTCDAGWKCKNENFKSFQLESCSWTKEEECQFGCVNATCQPKPENYTESSAATETAADTAAVTTVPLNILKAGETVQVTYNDKNYNLTLYLIEEGRAMLKLDNLRSDWLTENSNYTFSSGVKVNVKEILFQSYLGGIKQISYTIG